MSKNYINPTGWPEMKIQRPKPAKRGKSTPARMRQKDEWLGDAILLLYARLYWVEKNAQLTVGKAGTFIASATSNASLFAWAKATSFPGNANDVEIAIYGQWKASPEMAKNFCFSMFRWMEENLFKEVEIQIL